VSTGLSPIRNADQISDPCFTTSVPAVGDFGRSLITFQATASGDSNPAFSAGDVIELSFTQVRLGFQGFGFRVKCVEAS
jgi:hypothetical protein